MSVVPTTSNPTPKPGGFSIGVRRLVYELIYPAFLGAMVYELLKLEDPERLLNINAASLTWNQLGKGQPAWLVQWITRFLIVVLFCLSWLYVRSFKGRAREYHWLAHAVFCLVDLLCPLLYQAAFAFAQSEQYPRITGTTLLIIASLYLIAQALRVGEPGQKSGFWLAAFGGVIILAAYYFIRSPGWEIPAVLGLVALFIIFLVMQPSPRRTDPSDLEND